MEQLVTNKNYKIKINGQYCNSVSSDKALIECPEESSLLNVTFIGIITLPNGFNRAIFYDLDDEMTYHMFGTDNFDYVLSKEKCELIETIEKTEKHLKSLKQKLNE